MFVPRFQFGHGNNSCLCCRSPGFLPTYLLPAYDEVVDRPVTPPPPYTPLQSAHPSAHAPGESPDLRPAISVPGDVPPPATPEVAQTRLQGAHNPSKDSTPGRYRRFTGDSGIGVCDCQELWDQRSLLETEEETVDEGAGQTEGPCDRCGPDSRLGRDSDAVIAGHTDGHTAAETEPRALR